MKTNMPKIGGFPSFRTATRTIAGFEAMLWLKKNVDFEGHWIVRKQNRIMSLLSFSDFKKLTNMKMMLFTK